MAQDEVENGCCNAAISGPILVDGVCCWDFCAGACCGRPVRAAGIPVVAEVASRSDWQVPWHSQRDLSRLDAVTREALCADYTRDACFEHASVASFAVFVLELLAVGAPPELVAGAQSAAADEVEHARLMFGVASTFTVDGGAIGPGAFPLAGVAPRSDLAEVAVACVRDGCIGETIASLVATAQAERAEDGSIRAALSRIAEDEARHAELAWRFVRWAFGRGDARVRASIVAAFEADVPVVDVCPVGVDPIAWQAHGRLLAEDQRAIIELAMREVVGPCARVLGGRPHASRPHAEIANAGVVT